MQQAEGWYPDPTGDHQLRWFDGSRWTDYVMDAGVHGVSPLAPTPESSAPTPRIGDDLVRWWTDVRALSRRAAGGDRTVVAVATALAVVVAVAGGMVIGRATRPPAAPAASPTAGAIAALPSPAPTATPSASSEPTWSAVPTPAGGPVVTIDPAPPAGYTGQASVMSAQGFGDGESPAFATQGSSLLGGMTARTPGAVFYLVPEGVPFDATRKPTASCIAPCASGGWSVSLPPGRYRLVVRAAPGTPWSFDILEQVQPPLTFSVLPTPPPGATGDIPILHSAGVGDQQTPVFHVSVSSLIGVMGNQGAGSVFYLVPAGQAFNPAAHATASCAGGCASGGWSATVAPGDYFLVVRSVGSWTFDIDEIWR